MLDACTINDLSRPPGTKDTTHQATRVQIRKTLLPSLILSASVAAHFMVLLSSPPATVRGDATIMTIVPLGNTANHRRRRPEPMNQYGHADEYEGKKVR
jgi:hypothetical protein